MNQHLKFRNFVNIQTKFEGVGDQNFRKSTDRSHVDMLTNSNQFSEVLSR